LAQGDAGRESPFSLGAGARGMGMGRAFVSLSGDASSAFSNPAATAFIDRNEFTAFHTTLFLGTNYDCLAFSHPVGFLGVFSLSAGRLGTSDFIGRDDYNRPDKTISESDTHLGLSYGRAIGFGLSTGVTLKGIGQSVGTNTGYGFGLDFGLQYHPLMVKDLILGVGINDLLPPRIKLFQTEEKYQTDSRIGLAYSRQFAKNYKVTAVFEIEKIVGRGSRMHPGLEAEFYKDYCLRLGYDHNRPTFGAGITYSFVRLDYAYENIEFFGGSHRISVGFSFGKSAKITQSEVVARAVESEKAGWMASLDKQKEHDFTLNIDLADSLHRVGQNQQALAYYQRALAVDETSTKAKTMSDSMISLIISSAASSARDQKREEMISQRIASALDNFKAGRYNEAISEYELTLEIDPGNKTISDLLTSARDTRLKEIEDIRQSARSFRSNGDHTSAIMEWNKLLSLEPTDPEAKQGIDLSRNQLKADALVASAAAAINDGKYGDAVKYLGQAQSLRPGDKVINTMLSDARSKSAPVTSLNDIKSSPDRWAIYLNGLESYRSSDYNSALKSWESLREFYPNNPDLEKNISQAKQRLTAEGGKP
jgi:tetratricopeptide (TPR) repeat protein